MNFPSAAQLEEAASDVLDACAAHPERLIGVTYVSADHVDDSLRLIDRCIANGPCRAVKLWCVSVRRRPTPQSHHRAAH